MYKKSLKKCPKASRGGRKVYKWCGFCDYLAGQVVIYKISFRKTSAAHGAKLFTNSSSKGHGKVKITASVPHVHPHHKLNFSSSFFPQKGFSFPPCRHSKKTHTHVFFNQLKHQTRFSFITSNIRAWWVCEWSDMIGGRHISQTHKERDPSPSASLMLSWRPDPVRTRSLQLVNTPREPRTPFLPVLLEQTAICWKYSTMWSRFRTWKRRLFGFFLRVQTPLAMMRLFLFVVILLIFQAATVSLLHNRHTDIHGQTG